MLNNLFEEEYIETISTKPVTGVELSEIRNLTQAHKEYLLSVVYRDCPGPDEVTKKINLQNKIDQIDEKNRKGEYEEWMKEGFKYQQKDWWLAQAIRWDNIVLNRIAKGTFTAGCLKKLQANSTHITLTKTEKVKKDKINPIKQDWIKLLEDNNFDSELFNTASIEGIIYDI